MEMAVKNLTNGKQGMALGHTGNEDRHIPGGYNMAEKVLERKM